MLLSINNVSYQYRKGLPFVLRGVSCEFECGHTYAIVGGSGSGKTTFISLIAGLDHPSEGSVLYNGRDLRKINLDKYRAKSVAIIFQNYNLLSYHSALDNVKMSLWLSGYEGSYDKRAHELLGYVEIPEKEHLDDVSNLSGGEQQRVAIARALASDASIIIADEPTGNLDSGNSDNVMRLLCEQKSNGKCVIIVTHDKEIADKCDNILHIRNGCIKI